MDYDKPSLIDNIFLQMFRLYSSDKHLISYIRSQLLDRKTILDIPDKVVFPISIFKDFSFYFMLSFADYERHRTYIADIVLLLARGIESFIKDSTLKKGKAKVGDIKRLNFSKVKHSHDIIGYYIEANFKSEEAQFNFYYYIPRKSVDKIIYFLSKKNTSKISDIGVLSELIHGLRTEFYKRSLTFPLDILDFFNYISNNDLQRIMGLLISNNMITFDMLWALASRMDNGMDRIMNNLSKNQKEDFLSVIDKKADQSDYLWNSIVLYQLSLNMDILLKENKIESGVIFRVKNILGDIFHQEINSFFYFKPFDMWIKEANDKGVLQEFLSKCHDAILGKSFIFLSEESLAIIRANSSKRKFQTFMEDIEYYKRDIKKRDIYLAQYEAVTSLIDILFRKLTPKEKNTETWIKRFNKANDFNLAVHYVGPIDFSLALIPLPITVKRFVIKNLKPPIKHFVYYFLSNKIKLNFPYGEIRIKEASLEVVRSFYRLEKENKVSLKPIEKITEEDSINHTARLL